MTRDRMMLYALHVLGNAALLLLGYHWLGMGESDASHLAFSAFVILFFGAAVMWLHGTSFVFFRPEERAGLGNAAKRALRNLLPLFVLALVVLGIYIVLGMLSDSLGHEAFKVGSYSTMKLRRPVAPSAVSKTFHWIFWTIYWVFVPIFAFPLGSEVAAHGWRGFTFKAFRRTRDILFSLRAAAVLIAAVHFPVHLYLWLPKVSSFALEMLSFVFRIGLGYLVFTGGLLLIEFITSDGMPPATQESTAVSP